MASGGSDGTSGGRFEWRALVIIAAINVVVALVNVASDHNEIARGRLDTSWIEPWIWAFTSGAVIVALAPFVGLAVKWFPPARDRLAFLVLVHLVLATLFSIVHIAGMVALRELAYLALPWGYDFDSGGLFNQAVYEWRKDLITYFAIATGYWVWRNWPGFPEKAQVTGGPLRIEVRDGSKVMMLDADAINWIEAAGNYVEIHTANGAHTARGTLASFAERLEGAGFVRVHRSRLVNPARVVSYQPTASGDVEIAMADGAQLAGSRRFRADLAAALSGDGRN